MHLQIRCCRSQYHAVRDASSRDAAPLHFHDFLRRERSSLPHDGDDFLCGPNQDGAFWSILLPGLSGQTPIDSCAADTGYQLGCADRVASVLV